MPDEPVTGIPQALDPAPNPVPGGFWFQGCCPWIKQLALIALVSCYVGQTLLVYADPTRSEPLSAEALRGRRLWHTHNCQACHQMYGFGGFLGPDLTNAIGRLTDDRLRFILTEGASPMPSFGFSDDQIAALRAFLVAMDDSGQGQAKQRGVVQADQLVTSFTRVVRDELAGGDPEDARAFGLFLARDCMRCHVPFSRSSLGPDLSTVLDRMTVDEVHEVLQEGRKLMPAARLEPEQREQIIRYFGWLRRNRQTIQARSLAGSSRVTFQPFDLPWWEYR